MKAEIHPSRHRSPIARENFGLHRWSKTSSDLAKGKERIAKVQPQIDPLLDRFATLGEMREGSERLLEALDRFTVAITNRPNARTRGSIARRCAA